MAKPKSKGKAKSKPKNRAVKREQRLQKLKSMEANCLYQSFEPNRK